MSKKVPIPRTNTTVSATESLNFYCLSNGQTWYYDHFQELHNPPGIYQHLMSMASERIWIWDPYIHPEDAQLFDGLRKEVDVRILTCKGIQNGVIPPAYKKFFETIKPLQQSNGFKFEFAIYNKLKDAEKEAFHDRYLFIDGSVYAVGSSMEYHRRRITSTAVHLVGQEGAYELLATRFRYIWNHQNTEKAYSAAGGLL